MTAASFYPSLCFGKLPAFGDFVRHNAGGRDVLAFDQWLQHGIYQARTELRGDWETSYRSAPAYHFVFFPENSESLLLGVLKTSHDRSERSYPFTVCLRVDRRLSANRLPLIPMLFSPFLDEATRLVDDAKRNGISLQELADRTDALKAPVEFDFPRLSRDYETRLAAMNTDQLRQQLWESDGSARTRLVFKNLVDILSPLRGRNAGRLALGLRFPLPADRAAQRFTASFWLLAACALMGVNWPRPFFFWTAPTTCDANGTQHADPSYLFLFLRQPSGSTLRALLRPDVASESVCVLDADGLSEIEAGHAALPSRLAAAMSSSDASLLQLLDVLGGPLPRMSATHAGMAT